MQCCSCLWILRPTQYRGRLQRRSRLATFRGRHQHRRQRIVAVSYTPFPPEKLVAAYRRAVSRARRSIAQYQLQSQSMSWRLTNTAVWHSRSRLVTDAAVSARGFPTHTCEEVHGRATLHRVRMRPIAYACWSEIERERARLPRLSAELSRSTTMVPVEHSPEGAQGACGDLRMVGSRRGVSDDPPPCTVCDALHLCCASAPLLRPLRYFFSGMRSGTSSVGSRGCSGMSRRVTTSPPTR